MQIFSPRTPEKVQSNLICKRKDERKKKRRKESEKRKKKNPGGRKGGIDTYDVVSPQGQSRTEQGCF